jgi:hypothetical protein
MFIPVNLIINSGPFEKTLMPSIISVKFFGEKNKIIKTLLTNFFFFFFVFVN